MKKVRLFAVAAAMGMFASSVSAATQVGPVVQKTSGSFAWGEFASVMKVDMGDKVVAPQVSVTATTEGRTTDIDYATYKTATGLTKTSTCYVGFTNVVGKDANLDGINDTPLYIINGENGSNTDLTYFSSVDDAITYWANAGETLFGAKILAAGQAETDDVYTVAGATTTFADLEAVFDYLVEQEDVVVTKDEDGFISRIEFGTIEYYELYADGTKDLTRPAGTVSLAYECSVNKGKAETYVKEAIADLFVANSTTQHESYKTLQDYSSAYGTNAGKALFLEATQTTLSSKNTTVDYYYPTSVTKGVVDNYSGVISAAEITAHGAVIVTEYDSKYDVYVPNPTKTKVINSIIEAVQIDTYELAVAAEVASWTAVPSGVTTDATLSEYLQENVSGNVTAAEAKTICDKLAASAYDAALATLKSAVAGNVTAAANEAATIAAWRTTNVGASPKMVTAAELDEIFYGTEESAGEATRKTAAKDNGAVKKLSATATAPQSLVDLFNFAGLDYEPTAANVKNTFVAPGKVSIVEYDADRDQEEDFVVISYPKVQTAIKTTYTTIEDNFFDIVDASWVKGTRYSKTYTTAVETVSSLAALAATYPSVDLVEREKSANVTSNVFLGNFTLDASPLTISAGELTNGVYLSSAPENDTDYIVINLPSTTLNPYSQSRTKGTATYRSLVTGEEIMTHFVELQDVNAKTTHWYPAVETMADAKEFLRIALGIYTPGLSTPIDAASYIAAIKGDYDYVKVMTWIDGTKSYYWPANVYADASATQCTYSTLKGADTKTEAASVSFDASKVDTTKAGVYTATLTAKAGETTETKDVTVVVAPKYSRTWDNKGRVSTLKAYWLSGNLYAEYKYTYNADNTITVVSTFYREDGVTVADTATTTK